MTITSAATIVTIILEILATSVVEIIIITLESKMETTIAVLSFIKMELNDDKPPYNSYYYNYKFGNIIAMKKDKEEKDNDINCIVKEKDNNTNINYYADNNDDNNFNLSNVRIHGTKRKIETVSVRKLTFAMKAKIVLKYKWG